jgi:methyltransferase (TIGR00027 family)
MQLRTRFIDDALRAFAARGGTQVVLLGAGYDSRAVRLRTELPTLRYYEVDHPATAAVKRTLLPELADANVRFVTWDFQQQPMAALPEALRAQGHDRTQATLTIWEGVTMYLDVQAIEATVATVAAYSTPGSPLVFTYFDRARSIDRPTRRARAVSWLVASVGEPFRFGWAPTELPEWLQAHGFGLQQDVHAGGLAQQLLPPEHQHWVTDRDRHFAIAERASAPSGRVAARRREA